MPLSQGNIIVIYKDGNNKLIRSTMKTRQAQSKDIIEKWTEFVKDKEVKAIIWSAQSVDSIQFFVEFLLKNYIGLIKIIIIIFIILNKFLIIHIKI
jgi:hypothetical protein